MYVVHTTKCLKTQIKKIFVDIFQNRKKSGVLFRRNAFIGIFNMVLILSRFKMSHHPNNREIVAQSYLLARDTWIFARRVMFLLMQSVAQRLFAIGKPTKNPISIRKDMNDEDVRNLGKVDYAFKTYISLKCIWLWMKSLRSMIGSDSKQQWISD